MEVFDVNRHRSGKKDVFSQIISLTFCSEIDIPALKKLAAILFFLVVLFNFYGYRIVVSYMQNSSDAYLEKQVDKNNYDRQELISIKTKLDLPYYTSSSQYERAYGSINIDGVNYQYVKRRVYKDTLEVLCLPNHTKTKLQSVKNELTKDLADQESTTPKKNTTIKITLPDFFQPIRTFSFSSFTTQRQPLPDYISYLSEGFGTNFKEPPKASPVLL